MNFCLIGCHIAIVECFAACLLSVISEVNGVAFVVAEFDLHVLQCIVDCIVALESEETRRRAHCTDGAYELVPAARVEDIACGLRRNPQRQLLHHEGLIWFLGIGDWPVAVFDVHKV